jgi:hypothetical protein
LSAGARHYAEVFTGLTPGWTADRKAVPPAEEIVPRLTEIGDRSGYFVPDSVAFEMEHLADLADGDAMGPANN